MRVDFDANFDNPTDFLPYVGTAETRSNAPCLGYVVAIPEQREGRGQTVLRYVFNNSGSDLAVGTHTVRDLSSNPDFSYNVTVGGVANGATCTGIVFGQIIPDQEFGWVVIDGPVQMLSGGAITAGDAVEMGASGKLISAAGTDAAVGVAHEAAVGADELIWGRARCAG